jgi:hypothetical protein
MFSFYVGIIQVSYLCNTYQYWFICSYVLLYLGSLSVLILILCIFWIYMCIIF